MLSLFWRLGTVVADIAKSRAEIESARLLVYSAALQASIFIFFINFTINAMSSRLQIDKAKAKGALKEIGIAKASKRLACLVFIVLTSM